MTLIYVDLVRDEPLSAEDWHAKYDATFGEIAEDDEPEYQQYLDRFQPWRLLIKSGDNQEPLFKSTESYFNKADAENAARIGFGRGSNVYLRQSEHGNELLRLASDSPAE